MDTGDDVAREAVGAVPFYGVTTHQEKEFIMATILWIIAVAIAIFGVIRILRGDILWGIVLLIVAALVGPGGVSIFN